MIHSFNKGNSANQTRQIIPSLTLQLGGIAKSVDELYVGHQMRRIGFEYDKDQDGDKGVCALLFL
jgi:hypothetical protein